MGVALIALLALATQFVVSMYHFLDFGRQVTFNDASCRLVGDMAGSEDLARGKHGVLFISQGDLHTVFALGSAAAAPGLGLSGYTGLGAWLG